jgi:hypothetical protein
MNLSDPCLSSSSFSVREYGIYLLNKSLLDGEIYIDYILELLKTRNEKPDSSELQTFLLDCNIEEEKAAEITVKLRRSYRRGFLETGEVEEMNIPLTSPVPPPPGFPGQQSLISKQNVINQDETDEEEEDPLENDISAYSYEIDWISLIESLESHLSTYYHYSKPEFSPLALMIALYNGNYGYNLDYSAQLLLNASRILNECKPCRHLMQGSCLRKDCYFEHNLKSFPCRYWLFSVCANGPQQQEQLQQEGEQGKDILELTQSDSCLFSHDLPSYEQLQYIPPVIPIPEFPSSASSVSSSSSSTTTFETSEPLSDEQQQRKEIEEVVEEFPSLMTASTSSSNKKNKDNKNYSTKISPYLSAVKTSSSSKNQQPLPSASSFNNKGNGISTITNYKKVFSDLLINAQFISSPTSIASSQSRSGNKFHPTEWVESGYFLLVSFLFSSF